MAPVQSEECWGGGRVLWPAEGCTTSHLQQPAGLHRGLHPCCTSHRLLFRTDLQRKSNREGKREACRERVGWQHGKSLPRHTGRPCAKDPVAAPPSDPETHRSIRPLTHHQNQDPQLRPVRLWRHLLGDAVLAVGLLPHDPLHKAPEHASAGTSGALPGHLGELAAHVVQLGQRVDCKVKGRLSGQLPAQPSTAAPWARSSRPLSSHTHPGRRSPRQRRPAPRPWGSCSPRQCGPCRRG